MLRFLSCFAVCAAVWAAALPTARACISDTTDDPFEDRRRTVFTEFAPDLSLDGRAGLQVSGRF